MLLDDNTLIGERLYQYRKKAGMTQVDLAEVSGLSERAYANIERGSSNMRIETLIHICKALKITPNELLVSDDSSINEDQTAEILETLDTCPQRQRKTALAILKAYLNAESIEKVKNDC